MISHLDKIKINKHVNEEEKATLVVINPAFSAAALFAHITLCLQTIVFSIYKMWNTNHSVLSFHFFLSAWFRCVESHSATVSCSPDPRMTVDLTAWTRPGRSSRMVRAPWRRSGTGGSRSSPPPPSSTRTSPSPADSPATGWWCSHLSPADIPH